MPKNLIDIRPAALLLYKKKGYHTDLLKSKEAQAVIAYNFQRLREAIKEGMGTSRKSSFSRSSSFSSSQPAITYEIDPELAYALENNAWIFSGFKTHHLLRELGLSLTEADGSLKTFEKFYESARTLNERYNRHYLEAEFNHARASSQMALRWRQAEQQADRYDLQYRTAGDERVREEHALLDGITLPPSDPFWTKYYPPNGWNCRCTAVQVRRQKYPRTDPAEAMRRGEACLDTAKKRVFEFNPGKELRLFPRRHPYLPKGCGDCTFRVGFAFNGKKTSCRTCNIVTERPKLHELLRSLPKMKGLEHVKVLHAITQKKIFEKVEEHIYTAISKEAEDYDRLKDAADKAAAQDFDVYMLPNPPGITTADFIFKRKNFISLVELKTISGKATADSQLAAGNEQAPNIMLNITGNYPTSRLATDIKHHFEHNKVARKVIVAKGNKFLQIKRKQTASKNFTKDFRRQLEK